MSTPTPSQILNAEIERLMVDRRCDRPEATAICRQLMKNLANAADQEKSSLTTLTNISPQQHLKNMASKSNTPNPPSVVKSPAWGGVQRDSFQTKKSDPFGGATLSPDKLPTRGIDTPPDKIDVRPYWHYVLPSWPVPSIKLAEMGLPTNPVEEDWTLLVQAFKYTTIDPTLLAGLLAQIINARTDGHAMTLNDALEFVKQRTKAVANTAGAQFRGLVNTAVNQQGISFGEAWSLCEKAHPNLVDLMNAKAAPRPDEGVHLTNAARKSASEEFTGLVNQMMKATRYSFKDAWEACRIQHREVFNRMGN